MDEQNCAVFRMDNSHKGWLLKGIQAGRVHQKWGIRGMSLRGKGKDRTSVEWAEDYRIRALDAGYEHIDLPEAQRRHRVLSRMLHLKAGDLIVVPCFPEDNTLMILTVSGEYYFDNEYCSISTVLSGYGHIVPIDPNSLKVFSKHGYEKESHLYGQMIGFTDICNYVNDKVMRTSIIDLYSEEGLSLESEKDSFLQAVGESFNSSISEILKDKSVDQDFFHIVSQLFRQEGYAVSPGTLTLGDAGSRILVLERELPVISNCCQTNLRIYVKVHTRHDNAMSETESMAQLMTIVQNDLTALKFFISTTENKTEVAKDFADMNGVVYMSLPQFMQWLTSNLNYLYY